MIRSGNVHILFADINMPRLNGLDLARAAKEQDAKLKIVLITGYDYFDYVLTALRLGIDDYKLKPISKDDITELLIKLIEKGKAEDGLDSIRRQPTRFWICQGIGRLTALKECFLINSWKTLKIPIFL